MNHIMSKPRKQLLPLSLTMLLSMAAAGPASSSPPTPPLHLKTLMDVPLGGHATRLDYESIDAERQLLFIAHLGDGEGIAVDTDSHRLLKRIANVAQVHGVLAIPELGRVYASATGTNEVVAIDEKSLAIIARMPGGTYPDGLAYSPETHKVYVSDEHGGTDTVIDVAANTRAATVQIGGGIRHTPYQAGRHHIFIKWPETTGLAQG